MRTLLALTLLSTCAVSLCSCSFAALASSGPAMAVSSQEGVQQIEKLESFTEGRACVHNYFGLVTIGDGSIETAKRDGNLSQVASVDHEVTGINHWLIKFGKACTVVRGH